MAELVKSPCTGNAVLCPSAGERFHRITAEQRIHEIMRTPGDRYEYPRNWRLGVTEAYRDDRGCVV